MKNRFAAIHSLNRAGTRANGFSLSYVRCFFAPLRHAAVGLAGIGLLLGPPSAAAGEQEVLFRRDVLPILSDHCFQCHGPDERARQAGLRLDTPEGAFQVRNGRAVVAPGRTDQSELRRRIVSLDPDEIMPPPELKRPLTSAQIATLERWIEQGAPWSGHWAFDPLDAPEPPELPMWAARALNPIDHFIFARLEREGLSPSPEAPKSTLLRRVTLDLTGLPPTLEELGAFLADSEPDAYEKVVQRLLDSPAFGERMAWDWLDAARYADSNGYQGDAERTMWPWRDWVVEAFNRNLPFDQFTLWQLAGDLLPDPAFEQRMATAFSRNHMINGEGGRIPEENRVDYVMDMTETMGTVWLGITLNCSRCHDHKYDPITQRDYYSLFAFFNQTPVTGAGGDPQAPPNLELPTAEQTERLRSARRQIETLAAELDRIELELFPREPEGSSADSAQAVALPENLKTILKLPSARRNRNQLNDLETYFQSRAGAAEHVAQLQRLRQALEERDGINRAIVRVMIMEDRPEPRPTFLLDTGFYDKPREAVSPDVPSFLPPIEADAPRNRLGLAQWILSPGNPLPARVTVNRLWQQFFGAGLVRTPEEFGVQGEFPTHPELLDWLASEFVRSGWDWKHLCRLIVTSATYRQSSKASPELFETDPENRLLARAPRYRLPAWMIRDQALAASGLLVREMGGPPVRPYQPPGVWEEATFGLKRYVQDTGDALYRRSLYTFWRRIIAPTLFFDSASRQVCSVKPHRTNSPLHALATLNDITYVEAARVLAERVLIQAGACPDERLELAFKLVLARPPSNQERTVLRQSLVRLHGQFLENPQAAEAFLDTGESPRNLSLDPLEHAAFAGVCATLLNLDETLSRE